MRHAWEDEMCNMHRGKMRCVMCHAPWEDEMCNVSHTVGR